MADSGVASVAALAVLVGGGLLQGCSGPAFYRDWDPDYDFDEPATYAWWSETEAGAGAVSGLSPLDEPRVMRGLEAGLVERGLERVAPEEADLWVGIRFSTRERLEVSDYGPRFGWGFGPYNGTGYGFAQTGPWGIDVDQRTEGTLLVDLVDTESGRLVWRGWAVHDQEDFDRSTPQEREAAYEELTRGILEAFPPADSEIHE